MQATAEKPTCQYELVGGYVFTECGQKNWEHTTADLTTCQNCGKKIKRVERNDAVRKLKEIRIDMENADKFRER